MLSLPINRNKVIAILGPTASGKTRLAVALARKFQGEIISADSRQVYRGMDIGTGKDLASYGAVPYHLIDVASPRGQFTLVQYQHLAYRAIDDILRRSKVPIICGGTGLYVAAVTEGYQLNNFQFSIFNLKKIRRRLNQLTLPQLLARLKRVDHLTWASIDRQNRRRVERALEIYYQTGRPKSAVIGKRPPPYEFLQLGVRLQWEELDQRIARRLRQRLRQGMVAEVARLHRQGVSWKSLDAFGLEYRWVSRYLRKQIGRAEMEEKLERDIRRYSRRQMTWFRRDRKIHWVNAAKAEQLAVNFLRS